jgi:hypothetical protein
MVCGIMGVRAWARSWRCGMDDEERNELEAILIKMEQRLQGIEDGENGTEKFMEDIERRLTTIESSLFRVLEKVELMASRPKEKAIGTVVKSEFE